MGLLKVNRGLEKYFSKVELKNMKFSRFFSPKIIVQRSITNLKLVVKRKRAPQRLSGIESYKTITIPTWVDFFQELCQVGHTRSNSAALGLAPTYLERNWQSFRYQHCLELSGQPRHKCLVA